MTAEEFIRILHSVEPLKNNTRHSWTSSGRHESVADHSWRISLMAMLAKDEFPDADMDKVIRMCLIHDIGEAFTGDIPTFEKTQEDEDVESSAIERWLCSLPEPVQTELRDLYAEMDAMQTQEAKIYKAFDRLEAVLQHNEADISTWLPLEYDLQLTYGAENVTFSPWMTALKAQLNEDTRRKIRDEASAAHD